MKWFKQGMMVSALILGLQLQAASGFAQATVVRLAGSVTLVTKITAKKAEIEAASGQTLAMIGDTTLRGLLDAVEGRADIGLIGGPWDVVLADAQEKNPGKVDPATLAVTPLKATTLVFVTDASNPVKSLTLDQIASLLTGKTANWKDVGGNDVPVSLVLPPSSNGYRVMFQKGLLKGTPYAASAREIPDAKNIPIIVSQIPGGFAFLSFEIPLPPTAKTIPTDKPVAFPLSLVTLKTAPPAVTKTVEAITAVLK